MLILSPPIQQMFLHGVKMLRHGPNYDGKDKKEIENHFSGNARRFLALLRESG